MLAFPEIDPVAFSLGPLKVHWYGLMYLFGFISASLLGKYRIRKAGTRALMTSEQFDDLLFLGMLGVILGGRIGYVVFYNLPYYMQAPLEAFAIWDGGMSFHGGLIGVVLGAGYFAYRHRLNLFDLTDFIVPLTPLGLMFGRLGNFINGELWGRVTDVSWGMVFPHAGNLPRHPSQLYEMTLEGALLFIIVWIYSSKPRRTGQVSGVFLMGYGFARFMVEFTRQPDAQLGLLSLGLSMGQWLSVPMILFGFLLFIRGRKS
ncbi:MAG: prolipoprotein diacylglyceryl transferase [Alcaligenaceae bacterium]|nr:prolipoprotein diacylglyceryl transferase [Alcaligenaceae bacterium]